GNTVHGTDGTAHTYKDGNLETWIASTSISIEDGSTVGDVFKTVLDANGYTYEDLESNYISDITTPNGVTLSERSNGPNSGWMYLVNGVVPLVGVNDYVLSNGNSVIFFYTDDYTNEIGSEQWITPTEPSSSNEAISPAVTAHNGKAEASVDSEAIKSALSENSGKVVIAPKITVSAESVSISVSTSSIKEIAENSSGTLSVETNCGNVSFTNDILDSISEQADGDDVQISIETKSEEDVDLPETELENAVIVEIGISSGGNNITTFDGGDLSVSVPVTGEYSAGETYKVIVISSDGTVETLIGRVVVNEGKAFVEVSVSHLSTFVVTDTQAAAFDDVNTAAWYYDAVQYTSLNSIMTGVSKTDFAPNMEISRAMLVTVLYRLDGSPEATGNISFSDVEEDAWYKDAVIWASKNGIVKGRGDGTFGTNDSVKREEAAVILYRYALLRNMNTSKATELSQYSDACALSSWSQDAMRWANANRLITGTTANTLSPKGSMTRAQAATILMRFSEYPESTAQDTVSETAEATAAYMLKTVSTPQVGSIGGEWAVIGLVASGYDVPQTWLDNYYTTVEEYVTDRNGVLSSTKYTEYSRVILALTIIGKAADNVGTYDLTTYLADFENVVRQGLNGSIWALLALDSGNYDIPENSEVNVQATREMYIDEVLSNQLTSGGFSLTGQAPADVDITAMALCALSQYQSRSDVSSAVEKAIAYLSEKQGESGDYSSCCESTAQVIIALCSLGISADDSRFVKNGCTLTDGLTCYYAGNGQFRHISDGNVNQMATEQALLALAALKRAENGESSIYNIITAE
ncbi:MAG: DUF4430 domain-containing protein, partial [Clostridia bacterium]|nr:DUF4430 domain-containing protein [Clostridia bacterium]